MLPEKRRAFAAGTLWESAIASIPCKALSVPAALATPRGTNDLERLVDIVAPVSRVGDSVCARAFLAQVGSRPDFGKRLCHLYAEWRDRMGNDMQPDFPAEKMPDLMVVIQAFLHGLAIQRLVDPMNINVKSAGQLFSAMIDQFLANSGNASENIRAQ